MLSTPYMHSIEQSGGIHPPSADPASVTPSAPELEVMRFFLEPLVRSSAPFFLAAPSAVGRVAVDVRRGAMGWVQYSSRNIRPRRALELFNDMAHPQQSAALATATARTLAKSCRTPRRSWSP